MNILDKLSRHAVWISAIVLLLAWSSPSPILPLSSSAGNYSSSGIVIPLYTYPTDVTWDIVAKTKQSYPNVPMMAIVNPNSGPGSNYDTNYASGIQLLRNSGVIVLGYVPTDYGRTSISTVENEVNLYLRWYPEINGIMFDEMSNTPGNETYYSTLNSYVKSVGMNQSFGNAGTSVPSSFIGTMDVICIHEDNSSLSLSSIQSRTMGYPKSNFAYIQYGTYLPNVTYITDLSNYAHWMYFTNATLPNPYHGLPPYFTTFVADLSALDSSQKVAINIDSSFLNGTSFRGMRTIVETNNTVIAKGFTPYSFNATVSTKYTIVVDNYQSYIFDHWENGNTSSKITVSPSQATSLLAYYEVLVPTTTSKSALTSVSTATSPSDYTNSYSAASTLTRSVETTTTLSTRQTSTTYIHPTSVSTVGAVSSNAATSVGNTSTIPRSGNSNRTDSSAVIKASEGSGFPLIGVTRIALEYSISTSVIVVISGSAIVLRSKRSDSRRRYDRSWRW